MSSHDLQTESKFEPDDAFDKMKSKHSGSQEDLNNDRNIKDADVSSPGLTDGRSSTVPVGTLEKPVKPPRMRSVRSKDNPYIKDSGDPEASYLAPAGDQTEVKLLPPDTTSKETAVKQKRSVLDVVLGNKWILIGILAVVLVCLIILVVGVSISRKEKEPEPSLNDLINHPDPEVDNLMCGRARGTWAENHTVAVFKGIPYMKAPIGDLRWKTKELLIENLSDCSKNGTMTIDAKNFRGPCAQISNDHDKAFIGDEDCLYLNVWTPKLEVNGQLRDDSKLPVLVYIHGGFLQSGSGHEPQMSPSAKLARELGAVIVSFNYRLNVFGWISFRHMKGNYGLFDQIQALLWVKNYIKHFGGDESKVTLVGSTTVYPLIYSEEAKHLFARAWVISASSKFDDSPETIQQTNEVVYASNLNCGEDIKSCVMSKSTQDLVDAIPHFQYPSWGLEPLFDLPQKNVFVGPALTTDGSIVVQSPSNAIPTDKTVLIGNNEYETDRYQVTDVRKWKWPLYADYVRMRMSNHADSSTVLGMFPELQSSPRLHFSRIVSDLRAICPQTFLAEKMQQNGAKIYRYIMTASVPGNIADQFLSGSKVATHGTDLLIFFHYSDNDSEEFSNLKKEFRSQIKDFMENGKVFDWQSYPAVYDVSVAGTNLTNKWTSAYCDVWKKFYPMYSWIN